MTDQRTSDSRSEHPLFRVLILMGGTLSLNCGGVATNDPTLTAGSSSDHSGASAENPIASGGGASTVGGTSSTAGGTIDSAGAATSSAGAATSSAGADTSPIVASGAGVTLNGEFCPCEQWDCSASNTTCLPNLVQTDGCFCNHARPVTVLDCGVDQNLICLKAVNSAVAAPILNTWDGSIHTQCSCVSATLEYPSCTDACVSVFASLQPIFPPANVCTLHAADCTEPQCTATSSDILRQDGILCGCADIGLR